MDEIKQRLEETGAECVKTYAAWRGDEKSADTRSALQDAIHELRRVASRLEIEIAVSERDNSSSKPIPIPSHRSHGRSAQGANEREAKKDANDKKEAKAKKSVRDGLKPRKKAAE